MAASSSSGGDTVKEYSVMVPKATNMKYSIMKFNPANNVDFTKCEGAKIERENNLKQYKVSGFTNERVRSESRLPQQDHKL